MTGAFVLVTFAEPMVNGVICCQPGFTLKLDIESLGMTPEQQDNIAARTAILGEGCAIGFRYEEDCVSRPDHIQAIQNLLNRASDASATPIERFIYREKSGGQHSTVTHSPPDQEVIGEIDQFFHERI